ncbi:MAG TPA: pilus assembly protein [Novosphingobium sp.]|nr:pilus assembly protein [Novosphingobium sp.]
MTRARALLHRLRASRSGVAMTEFALSLPLLLTAGLWGVETAHLAMIHMRVSQLAIHIADNGSRIGDTSTLEDRKIYESDLNDLLLGANIQAGDALDFFQHGRAIISSLEVEPGSDRQYIHWQRCKGVKVFPSSYGDEGDTMANGMGPPDEQVSAEPGDAVIFVEVAYEYQPLVSARFVGATTIKATSAFMVRDDRDLSQIYQRDPGSPDPVSNCSAHDGFS